MKLMPECWLNNKANDNLVSLSCHPCCFIIVVVLIISSPFPSLLPPSPSYSFFTFNSSSSFTTLLPSSSFHTLLLLLFLFYLFRVQHISHSVSVPLIRQTPGLSAIPPSCLLAQTFLAHRLQHRCFCLGNRNIFSSSLKVIFTKTFSVRSTS